MKITIFSAKPYEKPFFIEANQSAHEMNFIEQSLNVDTASLATDCEVVCCFCMDQVNAQVLAELHQLGVKLIALRSSGYDHVDLQAASDLGLTVVNVPSYSPEAIAEFSIGMMLALSRKILQAHDKVRSHDFSLQGQLGFNLNGRTVGVIGTGSIGAITVKLLHGFGCKILAYDPIEDEGCRTLGAQYVPLEELFAQSEILSLHCPLNSETHHLINTQTLAKMRDGVMIINTGRGGLIDTEALFPALADGKISALGLDVYEHEKALFFKDRSNETLTDQLFLQLQEFPNVLITGHQAYFTEEALTNIASTTIESVNLFEKGISPKFVLNQDS